MNRPRLTSSDARRAAMSFVVLAAIGLFVFGSFSTEALAMTMRPTKTHTSGEVIYGVVKGQSGGDTFTVTVSHTVTVSRRGHGHGRTHTVIDATTATAGDGTYRIALPDQRGRVHVVLSGANGHPRDDIWVRISPHHAYRVSAKVVHRFGFWFFPVFSY
jgi:hypothetical protein